MKFSITIFLLALLNSFFWAVAQPNSNWHFGSGAAIKFTPSGPITVAGSKINTSEGCSTMSDANGNLLFYTDGVTVWNKNNEIMFNGTGLNGGSSSSQSSIVVPAPGNFNKFYIFTSVPAESDPSNRRDYCYNLVDMGLRGGLGEVVQKNIVFDTDCSERLTAANNTNEKDFWIITNTIRSNTFKAFALTENGLSSTPIISNVGEVVTGGIGMCKVSPNGQWLIQTFTRTAGLASAQLFSFNASTGQIFNPISLNTIFNCTYGCAFSPNSNRLYISGGFNCAGNPTNLLIQFSLSNKLEPLLLSTITLVRVNTQSLGSGDLSIGADNKLYIARNSSRLSRIENPNDTGSNLIFTDTAVLFPSPARVALGLPNYYNTINIPPSTIRVERLSCLRYRFSFPGANSFPFKGIYTWNFGDGSALSNDSMPIHEFKRSATDSFRVTLNFRSPNSLTSVNQEIVVVLPKKPTAQFSITTNGCVGNDLTIVNSSSSVNGIITNYHWHFGDRSTDNTFQPKKTYQDTGTYTIKLTVTDTLGCLSDTVFQVVRINKKAVANFKLQAPFCAGIPLQINDSSSTINTTINKWTYSWNFGNVFPTTTNGNIKPLFTVEGLYTIKLVVNTAEGCISDTVAKNYFIYNSPVANFILPKNCVLDESKFLNASSLGGISAITSYRWDFGVNSTLSDTSNKENPSYQYNSTGIYPVKLLVKTNQGCADSITLSFTVNGAIPIAKLAFPTNPVCSGDSVIIQNLSTVNFGNITKTEITWGNNTFTDDNPSPNGKYAFKFPEFGNPANAIEPIQIKAFSGISCSSQLDTTIILKAQPRVKFSLPISTICGNNLPFNLNQGTEINGAQGSFIYIGNGVQQVGNNNYQFNPRIPIPNSNSSIKYQFTTPQGCTDSIINSVTILPFPTANAGPDRILIRGESITLNASATGNNNQFLWNPASITNNPTILQPIVKTNTDTLLLLTATNDVGCFDTSSVFIKVLEPISPPNAFSPNSDGINDTWIIPNLNLYPNCKVFVYNRQGQMVFYSAGYNKPWDGNFNSKALPVSTYYYVIQLANDKPTLSGWLQILK